MFFGCFRLYTLDVSNFNVNNGVDIKGMFTSNVNRMKFLFKEILKNITNLLNLNVEKLIF